MNRSKIFTMIALLSFFSMPDAAAQADHAPSVAGGQSIQDVTRATPTPQDRQLNDQVRGALQGDAALQPALGDIQLKTVNGVVYLKGSVPSQDQQQKIEEKIRTLPGVSQVKSFIRIASH